MYVFDQIICFVPYIMTVARVVYGSDNMEPLSLRMLQCPVCSPFVVFFTLVATKPKHMIHLMYAFKSCSVQHCHLQWHNHCATLPPSMTVVSGTIWGGLGDEEAWREWKSHPNHSQSSQRSVQLKVKGRDVYDYDWECQLLLVTHWMWDDQRP